MLKIILLSLFSLMACQTVEQEDYALQKDCHRPNDQACIDLEHRCVVKNDLAACYYSATVYWYEGDLEKTRMYTQKGCDNENSYQWDSCDLYEKVAGRAPSSY